MSVESVEDAYAAGLFDGEGCVIFYHSPVAHSSQRLVTALSVSNCDRRCLDFLQFHYGGRVRRVEKKSSMNRWPIGIWDVTGSEAEYFANRILPYSILKQEQLQLFLEGRKLVTYRGGRISPKTQQRRLTIARRIKKLKRPQWVEV